MLFNNLKIEKGFKYVITITGNVKPNVSSLHWGGCQENTIKRIYNCNLQITDPFDGGKTIEQSTLPPFECVSENVKSFKKSCLVNQQFQIQFTLPSINTDKVYQLSLKNNQSVITYQHECPMHNQHGTFNFPVTVSPETKVEIIKQKE